MAKLPKESEFKYDLERVIDDWVLMGFMVGNDFIPHLPHMHIKQDHLPLIYAAYAKVLPGGTPRHALTGRFIASSADDELADGWEARRSRSSAGFQ